MTASPTQCPEAFHERLDKLQEDFPSVTILVITPETHNTFLDGDLRAESWDDPRHLAFRDRLKEWLESTYDSDGTLITPHSVREIPEEHYEILKKYLVEL